MLYKKSKKKFSKEEFKKPSSEYRGAPFWSWNCKLNKEQLLKQIDYFKEMGFGGAHIHPRTGLATEYLSDEFMDIVRSCVNKSKDLKMLSYLYDEDRWPSGFAGGLVTKNPEYRARHLLFTPFTTNEDDKRIFLASYDIVLNEDGTLLSWEMIDGDKEPIGTKWSAYIEISEPSSWFNNQTYVDTLNPKAIREFIKQTHERYKEAIGDEFGKSVPSVFTDEPQFTRKQILSTSFEKTSVVLPWTDDFCETYRKKYNEDILLNLPQLIWNLKDGVSLTRYRYNDHIAERFASSFADQCGKWCSENGISLTGHMMEEPTLESQTAALGEAMRSYRSFEIPGIDMLCDGMELNTAKQAQSAVHQYGKEGMLSELYGVTGWDFDFCGHKFQGDWQAVLGVTLRVPHLAWVSMEGEAKRDYPASIFYQSPWYKEYTAIEDHFARVNTLMTRGKPVVRIGVIHSIESYWLYWGPNDTNGQIKKELEENFSNLTKWLLKGQLDFDFIAESLFADLTEKGSNPLSVGKMKYDVVIVPSCITLRSTTIERLKQFQEAGGKLIFMGEAPKYADAVPSDLGKELCNKSTLISFSSGSLYRELAPYREIEIFNSNGNSADNLFYQLRKENDKYYLFVAHCVKNPYPNSSDEQNIIISIKGIHKPSLYNTQNGNIEPAGYYHSRGKTNIEVPLHEFESLLYVLEPTDDIITKDSLLPITKKVFTETLVCNSNYRYTLSEQNAMLLDMAYYALPNEPYSDKQEELLRIDTILRKKLGLPYFGEFNAQPWTLKEEPQIFYAKLLFEFESKGEFDGCFLAVENAEKTKIYLNNKEVKTKICGYYVDESIKTISLPRIEKGLNTIEMYLPISELLSIEWCYLLGNFGVEVKGINKVLTKLDDCLAFDSIVSQKLPFYSGNITYHIPFETKETLNAILNISYYKGALIKVSCDNKESGLIIYPPYEILLPDLKAGSHMLDVTLFGTRVNAFGPLHRCDFGNSWVGPYSWRTTGNCWSYEYQFKDIGILKSPEIGFYKK